MKNGHKNYCAGFILEMSGLTRNNTRIICMISWVVWIIIHEECQSSNYNYYNQPVIITIYHYNHYNHTYDGVDVDGGDDDVGVDGGDDGNSDDGVDGGDDVVGVVTGR